jgi:hypothetical protein
LQTEYHITEDEERIFDTSGNLQAGTTATALPFFTHNLGTLQGIFFLTDQVFLF